MTAETTPIQWPAVVRRTYQDESGQHWRVLQDGREERYEPEPEPPPEHDQAEAARPHLRERLLTLGQLGDLPPVRPLIDGLVYRDTLVGAWV
jgi:hypothetical protein